MRIALRVHGGLSARECAEHARAAEQAGFTTLWFAENPFTRGALPGLAASAVATQRIRLGIGVFNPFNRHPTLMAMEAAALDELSDGRVRLGVGAGIKVTQMGLPAHRRISAMRDTIHIVRRLLRGETVTYTGKMFSVTGVRLEFPLRRPEMPILMAAMGDQALQLCGELADGLMISNMSPPAFTQRAVGIVTRSAAEANRSAPVDVDRSAGASSPVPADVIQYVPCAIGDDGDEARRRAKITVGRMLTAYWQDGHASAATQSALLNYNDRDPEAFKGLLKRMASGEPAPDVIDDDLLRRYAIAGTPSECREQCAVYAAAGVTELAIWFAGPDATREIARFGPSLVR